MGEPFSVVLLVTAALKGASGAVGSAVVRVSVTRFERQLEVGRNRDRLIGHTADAIIEVRAATTSGDGGEPRKGLGRAEVVWLLGQLNKQVPPTLFVKRAEHDDGASSQSNRADAKYDSEPEAHWLYPIALWLIALIRQADHADRLTPPWQVRADSAVRRGGRRVASAMRSVLRLRKDSGRSDMISAREELNDVGVPRMPALRDVEKEPASQPRGLVQLVTDENARDIFWLAAVLDNLGWRLTGDRSMEAMVRHLRFEAQQKLGRTLVRQLSVAVAALTILGLSSIVGAVWLLTHW